MLRETPCFINTFIDKSEPKFSYENQELHIHSFFPEEIIFCSKTIQSV